jgi:hypothetical protein
MPIALNQKNGTDLLEVVVSGKISHDDFEHFGPKVEEMVKQHGKIRVLFDMVDFHGWEPTAIWDDTKFAFKHFCDITRLAMVGDKTWEKGMSAFCKPFTKAEIRYFDWSAIREAWAWLDVPRKKTLMHAAMAEAP